MATRRGRDYWILYDSDRGRSFYAVQRTYFIPGVGISTPLTPLFLARVISLPVSPGIVKISDKPRKFTACFANYLNQDNETNKVVETVLSVISPYAPNSLSSSSLLREHGIEIKNYENVLAVQYSGEVGTWQSN